MGIVQSQKAPLLVLQKWTSVLFWHSDLYSVAESQTKSSTMSNASALQISNAITNINAHTYVCEEVNKGDAPYACQDQGS